MANIEASETQNLPTAPALLQTPLYETIQKLKPRMTDFSGYSMPVQFAGINQEHQAVRTNAGIFDISHMGKFLFRGKNLIEKLQELVPSDLSRLQAGQAQYTVLLNGQGGILDDIIFYYQGCDDGGIHAGVMIVNAATKSQDKAWILTHLEAVNGENPEPVLMQDVSKDKVLIAIQGPKAVEYIQPFVKADLSVVKAFGHLESEVLGGVGFLARTGYTGEDGFEVMVDPEIGIKLWEFLIEAGVIPCGLGARDTLRLEAAMGLYGQDIDAHTTPLEAGLNWVVHLESKGDFIGRPVLEKQKQEGVKKRLVGLQMQGRNIARHGYPVLYEGKQVGVVTSGAPAPFLGYPIALALVASELSTVGQELQIEIRGKSYPAVVVKKPFYRSTSRLSK
ncbi:glycine cleavage system aminomethyltransferase GcvT [Ancylothrix sp. C2]|uniref:glycine cleavage system aminomethyltransferase GcvT n=1 Tax=Ancylothrix sp. D3o TaxID=2953691 RepID=UPI0021BBB238|nr:glycine cleavage system aminomethyltransferase GcvT [Ancylothrix sp. D3o]MCT7952400.1 glycine cleavage system aminomethyltransferase GcvT [Ancylothrix sp. D3o]